MESTIVYDNATGGIPADRQYVKTARGGMVTVDHKQGIIEAFVAAIGNKDSVNDIILPGAFNESLRRRHPRVVWGHDWNKPIGKVLEIQEVNANDSRLPIKMRAAGVGGLYVKVQFNLNSERGREAFEDVAFFGEDQQWSIGYKTIRNSFDPNRKANLLHEVELYEVSPVLHGANHLTATISVKNDENSTTSAGSGKYAFTTATPTEAGEYDFDEKVGRVVANRNMSKLRQALELLQSIVEEGGTDLERKLTAKTAYVVDFESKSALDFEDHEVLIYGDSSSVAGATLDFSIKSRDEAAEVLTRANDLICCKGYLAQIPHSEDGGLVKFYIPGDVELKDGILSLTEALESLSFEVSPTVVKVGEYKVSDSIPVKELFTEPVAPVTS